ncbi:PREDICTED: uncharacterized protein LOC106114109 [Papilio xuthus]|uniref:Uncharacterized protein LOC106114109 n=1 Tax=Papilio xuthus TaxID=66420 RepID=A0AAJ6Z0I6_PAPXU|nr:PREDICTED: uncharacterized protein LOC106114109 [Papilio xuthus]
MVRAGYADPRGDSCLGVSVASHRPPRPPRAASSSTSTSTSDSESEEEAVDVRSLATIIAHFERRSDADTDTDSEISASASEVRGPRRLPPWPRDLPADEEVEVEVEDVASVVSHTSLHLARITALHTKLQRAPPAPPAPASLHLARVTALHARRTGARGRGLF